MVGREKMDKSTEFGKWIAKGMIALVAALLLCGSRSPVFAADMETLVQVPAAGNAGDTVEVSLILNENVGISTIGFEMEYDEDILSYESASWLSSISSDSSNMTLVSDIVEAGVPKIRISAVLNSVFHESGKTFVTIVFRAKADFGIRPVSVTVRDASDENYNSIPVSVVYDEISPTEPEPSEESEESEESEQTEASESESNMELPGKPEDPEDPGTQVKPDGNATEIQEAADSETAGDKVDRTPATGAFDHVYAMMGIVVLLLLAACGFIAFMRHRRI